MLKSLVLGADLSTDSLKYVVVDAGTGSVAAEGSFNFLEHFGPKYGLEVGGYLDLGGGAVRIPYGLFPDALDLMFSRVCADLQADKQHLSRVIVSLQQHGMVAWKEGTDGRLHMLGKDPAAFLSQGINGFFATPMATSWRDTSSHEACVRLEQFLLADRWAELTGSSPLQAERFLGAQIDRLAAEDRSVFRGTEEFSVLASYVASLLVGWRVPIGLDEASCTLLMNLRRGEWSKTLRKFFPAGTFSRLSKIVEPCHRLGILWEYYVKRHGLPATCNVSLGMGDNIAAQVTTADEPNQVSLSMGSSGTVYKEMKGASLDKTHSCHVLRTATEGYMGMYCTQDCGKLADQVRQEAGLSWQEFDAVVASPQWVNPQVATFVKEGRIAGQVPRQMAAASVTRSIIVNMKRHCAFMGRPKSIVATGGFVTPPVAQMVADIFGCPVFVQAKMNRVAWGSVVMGVAQETQAAVPEVVKALCPKGNRVDPDSSRAEFYRQFEEHFARQFPG